MLVLIRKENERIVIGPDIVVTVLEARDGRVRLGFEAPQGTPIHREEVLEKISRPRANLANDGQKESKYYAECG